MRKYSRTFRYNSDIEKIFSKLNSNQISSFIRKAIVEKAKKDGIV